MIKPAAWLVAFVVALAYVAYEARVAPAAFMTDFRAFYCAGNVVRSGADPYRFGPLQACERTAQMSEPADIATLIVVPAPLPGYAIAPFVPLSALPFPIAAWLWSTLLCAATFGTIVIVTRLTGLPAVAVAAALVPVGIGWSAVLGELFPIAALALAAAAALLAARRDRWAAAAAACAMIEPHVGIAACLAMFALCPRTRLTLALAAVVAVGLSFATTGAGGTLAYFHDVVPAHALANASNDRQLSLTAVLSLLRWQPHDAVAFGDGMFLVMIAAGIAAAWKLATTTRERTYVVLVPPAFALFGGVHVHVTQIVVAVLPFLVLAAREQRYRPVLTVAIALIMLPWHFLANPALLPFVPVAVAVFVRAMVGGRLALAAPLAATVIMLVAVAFAARGWGPIVPPFHPHQYPPDALSQVAWADFVTRVLSSHDAITLWLRIPTWAGMIVGLATVARVALRPRPAPFNARFSVAV